MDVTMEIEVAEQISAPPERVYDLVADLGAMGEWSPENTGGEWLQGGPGEVGARFRGNNVSGAARWDGELVVTVAERGRELAWVMGGDPASPRGTWRYRFEASDGGTKVVESYALGPAPSGFRNQLTDKPPDVVSRIVESRRAALVEGMRTTLHRLKKTAESAQ